MDTRIKIYLLTGLLLALTCPTNCDEEASSATPSASVQQSTSARPQSSPSTSTTMAQESTHVPSQSDLSRSTTIPQESMSDSLQNEPSASPTEVQVITSAPTESNTSPPVLATTITQRPTTTTTTQAATSTSLSEVPDTTILALESGTSQDSQEGGSGEVDISTTSSVNLSTEGAGSIVVSQATEILQSPSVASTFSTLAETTETSSTSTAATSSTETTARNAITTPPTLLETSSTLVDEFASRQSTTTQINIISLEPTDGPELSPSHGGESSTSSASPLPGNKQTSAAPAELITSPSSSVTFATSGVTISGENGKTLSAENYTSDSPEFEPSEDPMSEPSTGKTGSSECSYQHFLVSVILSVLFINLVFCALTSLCVYRIVTKHHFYSWDPPPIRYGSVDYGISMGRRNMGLDLSPETPDGIPLPPRSTHEQLQLKNRDSGIPIVITNEDGWCVPYSEDSGVPRGAGEQGQEGTRKTNGNASNRADVDTGL